jgi:ribosomal protein S18 acetylase RimI-like enzyme
MSEQVITRFDGPRPARVEERDELIAMVNLVFRTLAGREPTIGIDWAHVYDPANLANVMVVCDQERVVASTGLWTNEVALGDARLLVGGINCVGTLPDYRRHGLGSSVVEAAQARMRDLGCHVGLLVTGISSWYRRLGWDDAGLVHSYSLNRGNIALLPRLPATVHVRLVETGQDGDAGVAREVAGEVVRLHNEQRMGALRTVEQFRQLLAAKGNPRLLLAESEGVLLAYLLVRENSLLEWVGSAENVAGLVRACFEMLDDPQASTSERSNEAGPIALRNLTLSTPGWQQPLVARLDALRIPYSSSYLGMMYVVDPRAVLDAFGLSAIGVSAEGEAFNLTYQGERVTLHRSQLAKLFFGPERVSPFAAELLPLPFWQWNLEKV